MNMDFEQLLKQEVQKAARQDYEEITAKAQDYPYKFSKEFNEKMKGIIREGKKAKKKRRVNILLVAAILLILNAGEQNYTGWVLWLAYGFSFAAFFMSALNVAALLRSSKEK